MLKVCFSCAALCLVSACVTADEMNPLTSRVETLEARADNADGRISELYARTDSHEKRIFDLSCDINSVRSKTDLFEVDKRKAKDGVADFYALPKNADRTYDLEGC